MIAARFEQSSHGPCPHVTPVLEAERSDPSRCRRNIGKVVLRIAHQAAATATSDAIEASASAPLSSTSSSLSAAHLLTGGLGGLGVLTARWLASTGIRRLVLASRSGRRAGGTEREWELLQQSGAHLVLARGDVADGVDVANALLAAHAVDDRWRIAGLWHTSGVLTDGLVVRQSATSLRAVFGPKAVGALLLQCALQPMPLAACTMFSSIAALFYGASQANYAAANSCLDTLALVRRESGLRAVSMQWGPWGELGMAAGASIHGESYAIRTTTVPPCIPLRHRPA